MTANSTSVPVPPSTASFSTLPLLNELTEEQFVKVALIASLTKDVNSVALATQLSLEELFTLIVQYGGSWLFVPKMEIFETIRNAVNGVVSVVSGNMELGKAARSYTTRKKLIQQAVGFVQAHTAALNGLAKKVSHREAKQRYRARRRAEGFSSRGRPLKRK